MKDDSPGKKFFLSKLSSYHFIYQLRVHCFFFEGFESLCRWCVSNVSNEKHQATASAVQGVALKYNLTWRCPGGIRWKKIRNWHGCFQKLGYPQIIHLFIGFHYKPSILGYPYFSKHPHKRWVLPPPRIPVTTRILTFLVGDSELNLHLPLESWEEATSNINVQNPWLTFHWILVG